MAENQPGIDRRFIAARFAAIVIGLVGGLFGIGYTVLHGLGAPQVIGLYVLVTLFMWGLNGFFFRKLPFGGFSLLLFSAGVLGALIFVGYLVGGVLTPWFSTAGGRMVGLLHVTDLLWYGLAVMTIAGAAGTAFSRNIIYSAWALLFAFMGVAGLYVFLGADFPAVAQVLIYVGGILVLILFAVMLTKQLGEDPKLSNSHVGFPVGAAIAVVAVGMLAYMSVMAPWKLSATQAFVPSSAGLGVAFLTDFLLPFEIASVVLLAALIGSVVIARKEIKETNEVPLS